jgi:hypothetical protein
VLFGRGRAGDHDSMAPNLIDAFAEAVKLGYAAG